MRILLTAITLLVGLSVLHAHEQRLGPRGGALVDAGSYHVELIIVDKTVDIFVSDAGDKPLSATGFKALAILAVSGKSVRVTLEPVADGSKLTGLAGDTLPKKVKGAIQLTGSDGKTSTGRIN